jgi:NAD+ synthase
MLPSLDINPTTEIERLSAWLRTAIHHTLRKGGAVVGISGGIDSAVVLALCARALGSARVLGVLMPERESSPESAVLAQTLADQYGVATVTEDISATLDGAGCYARRDEAIRRAFPAYGPGWGAKIGLAGDVLATGALNVFRLTVTDPAGKTHTARLGPRDFNQIVAASNFKQRARMMLLYYHAEARNWAVVGTAQKNEHELGFFVKHGDGGVDLQPLAHLYKTQVYQLACALDIPVAIQARTPTTDTYPGGSTQEEFFYRLPFEQLDAIWLGHERGLSSSEIAAASALTVEQVAHVTADIDAKRRATAYLRRSALRLGE